MNKVINLMIMHYSRVYAIPQKKLIKSPGQIQIFIQSFYKRMLTSFTRSIASVGK